MTVLVEDGAALERDIARDRAADDRDVAVVSYCAAAQPTDAIAPAERDVLQRKIARRAYRHQTKRGGILAADAARPVFALRSASASEHLPSPSLISGGVFGVTLIVAA